MSPRIPALQAGGHVGTSGMVQRHSEFLRDGPKESPEELGCRVQRPRVEGAVRLTRVLNPPPQPPKAPPQGWGPRRDTVGRSYSHH